MSGLSTSDEQDFNPDELREKYRKERDKRLRSDGSAQYREVVGALKEFKDDPHVTEKIERDPIEEELDVVIIGGGFGGLVAGARLRDAGLDDVRIIERAGDFGGTWYWNRYPGAQCDVESYIYLPLLEEVGYIPKEKYSYQPEIFAHAQRIGKHYDLYKRACFQTQVTEQRWDEPTKRWVISTNRGDKFSARFVIASTGPLNRPKLPGIPGIESFKGATFHTSRWDYGYTGGSPSGNLENLKDKRVGVIGTGATSVQIVPFLGQDAGHLYVFQRTPSSVDVRGNCPTDPDWAKTLQPGWQRKRRLNFSTIVTGGEVEEDLIADGWTHIFQNLATIIGQQDAPAGEEAEAIDPMELADFRKMNEVRARIDAIVDDKADAESLKPWYRQFCKRPTFNDEYLASFNRPNVTLVDTQGKGVEEITETGVVVGGKPYELDCLVFATGFEVGTELSRRAEFEIYGRNGVALGDYWKDGMKTFHGHSSHGFPNFFHLGVTQNGVCVNFTSMLDEQSRHISYVLHQVKEKGAEVVEPTIEAQNEWVSTILELASGGHDFYEACTPGFYNDEGNAGSGKGLADQQYALGPVAFHQLLQDWREEGSLSGLELK